MTFGFERVIWLGIGFYALAVPLLVTGPRSDRPDA
jgi:hypothetical protein